MLTLPTSRCPGATRSTRILTSPPWSVTPCQSLLVWRSTVAPAAVGPSVRATNSPRIAATRRPRIRTPFDCWLGPIVPRSLRLVMMFGDLGPFSMREPRRRSEREHAALPLGHVAVELAVPHGHDAPQDVDAGLSLHDD